MMELFKQLQKKNNFFLFLLIFFLTFDSSSAKIFSNNLELNGSFIQGGLLFGKTQSENKVFFKNQNIFVFS